MLSYRHRVCIISLSYDFSFHLHVVLLFLCEFFHKGVIKLAWSVYAKLHMQQLVYAAATWPMRIFGASYKHCCTHTWNLISQMSIAVLGGKKVHTVQLTFAYTYMLHSFGGFASKVYTCLLSETQAAEAGHKPWCSDRLLQDCMQRRTQWIPVVLQSTTVWLWSWLPLIHFWFILSWGQLNFKMLIPFHLCPQMFISQIESEDVEVKV